MKLLIITLLLILTQYGPQPEREKVVERTPKVRVTCRVDGTTEYQYFIPGVFYYCDPKDFGDPEKIK